MIATKRLNCTTNASDVHSCQSLECSYEWDIFQARSRGSRTRSPSAHAFQSISIAFTYMWRHCFIKKVNPTKEHRFTQLNTKSNAHILVLDSTSKLVLTRGFGSNAWIRNGLCIVKRRAILGSTSTFSTVRLFRRRWLTPLNFAVCVARLQRGFTLLPIFLFFLQHAGQHSLEESLHIILCWALLLTRWDLEIFAISHW